MPRLLWLMLLIVPGLLAGHWAQARTAPATLVVCDNQISRTALKAVYAAFTRATGIRVESIWIDQTDYKSLLMRHVADDTVADVVLMPADFLGNAAELRLSEIPPGAVNADVLPRLAAIGRINKRLLGVPVTWGNHLMLFYNRDLVPQPVQSFEELERQAPALRARGLMPLAMNWQEMYWLVPFIGAFGGWPLDEQDRLQLDTPAVAAALAWYAGLPARGLTDAQCGQACVLEHFAHGRAAYAIGGDWMLHDMESHLGRKLGVSVLPTIGKRRPISMYSALVLAFPNESLSGPKRRHLLEFARFMQSPQAQQIFARARLFPVNQAVYQDYAEGSDELIRGALAQMQYARPMPTSRSMAYAWVGMRKGFAALQRGASPQQAAARMQQHAQRVAARDRH